ncbi:MAG: hypothetical protein ABSH34_24400 [Verrucomicrobiota bacterium]|jgi:hypothetical protein
MNNLEPNAKWKKALRWIALTLASLVVLDWLLDGRLRQRLPLRRKAGQRPPPIQ